MVLCRNHFRIPIPERCQLCQFVCASQSTDSFIRENFVGLHTLIDKRVEWVPPIPSTVDACASLADIESTGTTNTALGPFYKNSQTILDTIAALDDTKFVGSVVLHELMPLLHSGLPDAFVPPGTPAYDGSLATVDAAMSFAKRLHGFHSSGHICRFACCVNQPTKARDGAERSTLFSIVQGQLALDPANNA